MSLREEDGKVFLEWTMDFRADGWEFPGEAGKRAAAEAKGWGPGTVVAEDPLGRGLVVAAAGIDAEKSWSEDLGIGPLRMRVWLESLEGADEIWRIECAAELLDVERLSRESAAARQAFSGGASECLEEHVLHLLHMRRMFLEPEKSDGGLDLDGWDFGEETSEARGVDFGEETSEARGVAALERASLARGGPEAARGKPRGM